MNSKTNPYLKLLKDNLKLIEIILVPLICLIIPAVIQTKESYAGFILLVMCLYWVLECLPLAITGLLPIVLFPMFSILSSKCVSQIYFKDTQMLFYGAMMVAVGIEATGLHERIALKIILIFGSNPKWLLLGCMILTGFLSLWIQNTSAASMMLPIVIELVKQLTRNNKMYQNDAKRNAVQDISMKRLDRVQKADDEFIENEQGHQHELPDTKIARKLMKGFCLGIAYSASTGGAGSLVGTTPNLVLKGHFDKFHKDAGLTFVTYMEFALPISIIMIFFLWVVLTILWLPKNILFQFNFKNKKNKEQLEVDNALKNAIKAKYSELGPLKFKEGCIAVLFLCLVILWLTRDFGQYKGWSILFIDSFVTDTTPAMLIVLLMFILPKENIFRGRPYEHLIGWNDIKERFPWDVILLGGGSLALAEGFEKSGLSKWVGEILGDVLPKQKELALLILLVFGLIGTEFTSNTSMASILIPIADSLAIKNGINSAYFLLPITVSVSLAFMFPVATQPNTIVFGSGYIKVKDMIISGVIIKIIGVGALLLAANTWLFPIFPNSLFENSSNGIVGQIITTQLNNSTCPVCECG